jgi:guanine deaminase
MNRDNDIKFLRHAIQLGLNKMQQGFGGPFGAIVVKDGQIVSEGWNAVTSSNDPTAHAEVQAIRKACEKLKSYQLDGCVLYTSCEPCPMCLGAIYWARPEKIYYSATREIAADAGFDDAFIYDEIPKAPSERKFPLEHIVLPEAQQAFDAWKSKSDKKPY